MGSMFSKPKKQSVPAPAPVVPLADPEAVDRDKRRKTADQKNRSASRASTILTDNSGDTLG